LMRPCARWLGEDSMYGLRHRREASGRRNTAERWFGRVKARIKSFYNNFPFHSTLESAAGWMDSFTALHNLGRRLSWQPRASSAEMES